MEDRAGVAMAGEIAVLVDGGFQKFFRAPSGKKKPALADELQALHDTGSSVSFFNRLDFHPNDVNSLHLNIQSAKSGFDVPNTYDQIA